MEQSLNEREQHTEQITLPIQPRLRRRVERSKCWSLKDAR